MTVGLTSTKAGTSTAAGAIFYNSVNCSGAAVTQVPVSTGRNTITISMRDPNAETARITASAVGLTAGTLDVVVSPSQFVLSGGPVTTLSGQCSSVLVNDRIVE